jgi:hypothetical protein
LVWRERGDLRVGAKHHRREAGLGGKRGVDDFGYGVSDIHAVRIAIRGASVERGVEVWAVLAFDTVPPRRALFELVVHRVIFLLLPPVAHAALQQIRTARLHVAEDERPCFPGRAHLPAVVVVLWLSTVVLPVVGIGALGLIMLRVVRTPDCLKEEHVEDLILRDAMNQLNLDVMLRVSETTLAHVLALLERIRVVRTELSLVLVHMIQLLDAVVRFWTGISSTAAFRPLAEFY